jgi:hypothetical protein
MGFDAQRFAATVLVARTTTVPVPELRPWFGESEPVWTVRGLSGEEIARANEAESRNANVAAVAEALASAQSGDKADAIKTMLGVSNAVPAALAKRIDHLIFGSVEPAIDREMAVRLFEHFPVVAFGLTNKILELTGQGAQPGKLDGSGDSPTSEPR